MKNYTACDKAVKDEINLVLWLCNLKDHSSRCCSDKNTQPYKGSRLNEYCQEIIKDYPNSAIDPHRYRFVPSGQYTICDTLHTKIKRKMKKFDAEKKKERTRRIQTPGTSPSIAQPPFFQCSNTG